MTSKGAKETIVSRLGFKSSGSAPKAEAELERVRKENAHLRRKIDELAKRHIKPPDCDKSKLLERILSLETMRERNNQQLLGKEQELQNMRQQLTAKGGEVVASLQAQLEQRKKEVEQKDLLYQNVTQETQNLRNQLETLSTRCQSLETQLAKPQSTPDDLAAVQDQLRDALEKNQQWLAYDQQREAYVQSVVVRTVELEEQLAQVKQQQQSQQEATSGASSTSSTAEKDTRLKSQYGQLLTSVLKELESRKEELSRTQQELSAQKEQKASVQAELQTQREQAARLQDEVAAVCRSCKEKSRELEEAKRKLKDEQRGRSNEKEALCRQTDRMMMELKSLHAQLEEEKSRSADLLLQFNTLQKSLARPNEDQRRITALEQQIQLTAEDFENERLDRRGMQHQLHKVLKELRKARDQISKLESAKQPSSRFSEPTSCDSMALEHLAIDNSPSKAGGLLDTSFLECPNCQASYPASRHRELLAHIDFCMA